VTIGPALDGFLLQASLIVALGAQNLFVLESGLKRRRHLLVAAICSCFDAALIAVGVVGSASVFGQFPDAKVIFGAVGAAFLAYYGVMKLKEAWRPAPVDASSARGSVSMRETVMLCSAFSLLNPHVYLDTMILIGGYAAKFPELSRRLAFGAGAASFSVLWFFGLSLFASTLSALLNNPRSMRAISLVAGIILLVMSWKFGALTYGWMLTTPVRPMYG